MTSWIPPGARFVEVFSVPTGRPVLDVGELIGEVKIKRSRTVINDVPTPQPVPELTVQLPNNQIFAFNGILSGNIFNFFSTGVFTFNTEGGGSGFFTAGNFSNLALNNGLSGLNLPNFAATQAPGATRIPFQGVIQTATGPGTTNLILAIGTEDSGGNEDVTLLPLSYIQAVRIG